MEASRLPRVVADKSYAHLVVGCEAEVVLVDAACAAVVVEPARRVQLVALCDHHRRRTRHKVELGRWQRVLEVEVVVVGAVRGL